MKNKSFRNSTTLSWIMIASGGTLFVCGACILSLLLLLAAVPTDTSTENAEGFWVLVLICPAPLIVIGAIPLVMGYLLLRKARKNKVQAGSGDDAGMLPDVKSSSTSSPPILSGQDFETELNPFLESPLEESVPLMAMDVEGTSSSAVALASDLSSSVESEENELPDFLPPPLLTEVKGTGDAPEMVSSVVQEDHAGVLHALARQHNWDEGVDRLLQIIRDPDCDQGTALMIYWMGRPEWDLQFADRSAVPDWRLAEYDLLAEIKRRYQEGAYTLHTIPFNPHDDEGYDWTNQYPELVEQFKYEIPTLMFEPVLGKMTEAQVVILCPYCMSPIAEDTVICPTCKEDTTRDAPLELSMVEYAAASRTLCDQCGKEVLALAIKCPKCGAHLK